jgi:monofunctional biosynthetic peptidoglycan transglycosylase
MPWLRIVALSLATGLLPAQDDTESLRLLTSFDGTGLPLQWYTVLDGVMGGRSTGSFHVADGRIDFTGTLNTKGGGFSSIRTRPQRLDLGEFAGLRLRIRGDGRVYTMRVQQRRADGRGSVDYQTAFRTAADSDAWQEVWLSFADFVPTWRGRRLDLPPVEPSHIDALGVTLADETDGPFRLEIDAIHAYRPFALADHRDRHRLLVVFAPRGDDERLATQAAAVEASRAAFAERDLLLIIVAAGGVARADGEPLSADQVRSLRGAFAEHGDDAFEVVLVGTDGRVARRATEPVAMSEIYEQIDAMPRRRAEVEERRQVTRGPARGWGGTAR